MYKINRLIIFLAAIFVLPSCDKGFEEVNRNPYALTDIDPALLFANAVRATYTGSWEGEQTIVQQFMNAYNLGATSAFNFNENNNNFNFPRWNSTYGNTAKFLEQGLELLADNDTRPNLKSMMRIWRAYAYMTMVDTYGDVPYKEASKAFIEAIFYPTYDKDEDIYADLEKELKEAINTLSTSGDFVKEDLFYGKSANTADQVAKWKKMGNSLLLRLGMRYSKVNPTKAQGIVQAAVQGGVIDNNDGDAYLLFNSLYTNQLNAGPRGINPYYYYVAEPLVNYLKTNNDPRMKYIVGKYTDPNLILASSPDTDPAKQFGFPVGYDQTSVLTLPGYRGTAGTGQNYSQLNYNVLGGAFSPIFYVSHAQTKLLMAEAAKRGWITGSAKDLYEAGIKADMQAWSIYPGANTPAVSDAEANAYLQSPGIAYDDAKALDLINTQYWLINIGNGAESFANFRRSGFPALEPNKYNNNLNGGFARRFAYPTDENSRNSDNYQSAVARIGSDNLTTRVFWDKP